LHLKDSVKPVFQKARTVPYALRPAVEKELKKMEDEGIIEQEEVRGKVSWGKVPTWKKFTKIDLRSVDRA